jgi:uncharacterized protein with NRDE domain
VCLILFAWQAHPRYPLVVAANRDEFHDRPTRPAGFWQDAPGVLAGRDLQAGGTWLGVSRGGRFAAVTNYREPLAPEIPLERSRGHLVRDFLQDDTTPDRHAAVLANDGNAYRGFNLLIGTPASLWWYSNRASAPVEIRPGSHGLSNHLLDTDWPKVHSGRERLAQLLDGETVETEALFALLSDPALTPGAFPTDIEASLAPKELMRHYFIISPVYGTRSSTVVLLDREGTVELAERQFDPEGREMDTRRFEFPVRAGD